MSFLVHRVIYHNIYQNKGVMLRSGNMDWLKASQIFILLTFYNLLNGVYMQCDNTKIIKISEMLNSIHQLNSSIQSLEKTINDQVKLKAD